MSVFGIKLVNGDEIIAKVDKVITGNFSKIKLVKPAIIGFLQNANGVPSLGLADYLVSSEKKEIFIEETHIIFMYEPRTDMLNAYNEMFGSGLVIPKPSLVGTDGIIPFTKKP